MRARVGQALAPFALALTAALAAAAAFSAPTFPALTGRVVDAAGILSSNTEAALTERLEAYERGSGYQLVVATVTDLGGLDIADYGYQLGRAWGVGDKQHSTGALLIVAPNQRAVRIEVGYGLEGDLTDAMASNIIQTRVLPAFRGGDYDGGVLAGVDGMIAVLQGDDAAAEPAAGAKKLMPGIVFWLIVLFIVLSSLGGPRRGGLARALFWGSVLGGASGRGGGGGGGFHGGGGSFGGGGASGRW
jgi:uncharacterized protein